MFAIGSEVTRPIRPMHCFNAFHHMLMITCCRLWTRSPDQGRAGANYIRATSVAVIALHRGWLLTTSNVERAPLSMSRLVRERTERARSHQLARLPSLMNQSTAMRRLYRLGGYRRRATLRQAASGALTYGGVAVLVHLMGMEVSVRPQRRHARYACELHWASRGARFRAALCAACGRPYRYKATPWLVPLEKRAGDKDRHVALQSLRKYPSRKAASPGAPSGQSIWSAEPIGGCQLRHRSDPR